MWYFDDLHPFSLRRPWIDRTPLQLNASGLFELHVVRGWYVNGEFGVLGLTQHDSEYLFGVNFEYRFYRWLFHGGFSMTGTFASYFYPVAREDYQQVLRESPEGFHQPLDPWQAHYDYGIHPEFAAQFYF